MPEGFTEIASWDHRSTLSATANNKTTEKLFWNGVVPCATIPPLTHNRTRMEDTATVMTEATPEAAAPAVEEVTPEVAPEVAA